MNQHCRKVCIVMALLLICLSIGCVRKKLPDEQIERMINNADDFVSNLDVHECGFVISEKVYKIVVSNENELLQLKIGGQRYNAEALKSTDPIYEEVFERSERILSLLQKCYTERMFDVPYDSQEELALTLCAEVNAEGLALFSEFVTAERAVISLYSQSELEPLSITIQFMNGSRQVASYDFGMVNTRVIFG